MRRRPPLLLLGCGLLLAAACRHSSGPDSEGGFPEPVPPGQHLSGRVETADGSPAAGASLVCRLDRRPAFTGEAAGRRTIRGVTDPEGRFDVPAPRAAGYLSLWLGTEQGERLVGAAPYPLRRWFVPGTTYRVPSVSGSLPVVVRDEEGRPVVEARVQPVLGGRGGPAPEPGCATTDSAGRAVLHGLDPAEWWLDVLPPAGLAPVRVPVVAPREGGSARVVVPMGRRIEGRVTGEGGEAIPGTWVVCSFTNDDGRSTSFWYLDVDDRGRFQVGLPTRRPFRLVAGAPQHAPDLFTGLPENGRLLVRLQRRPHSASGGQPRGAIIGHEGPAGRRVHGGHSHSELAVAPGRLRPGGRDHGPGRPSGPLPDLHDRAEPLPAQAGEGPGSGGQGPQDRLLRGGPDA